MSVLGVQLRVITFKDLARDPNQYQSQINNFRLTSRIFLLAQRKY